MGDLFGITEYKIESKLNFILNRLNVVGSTSSGAMGPDPG